jgi:DNA-binding response OmpR family regulator
MKHSENGNPPRAAGVNVLIISSADRHLADLQSVFRSCEWKMRCVPSLRDGVSALPSMAPVVVICDDQLEDGDWKLAVNAIAKAECPPPLIVTSRIADNHMWAEVLNLGAWDLLAKPYVPSEVIYVVGSAWRRALLPLTACRRPMSELEAA